MLAIATTLLAGALSQHQFRQPCDFPSTFTAQETAYNTASNVVEHGIYVYDGVNQRIYRQEIDTGPGTQDAYERILMFRDKREYNINLRTRECTYNEIPAARAWNPWGVPKNSTFQRQTILGLSVGAANWITADVFALQNHRTGSVSRTMTMYVTNEECAPISVQVMARTDAGYVDLDHSISMHFENMVLGIENPNVFNLPEGCREAPRPGPAPGPAPGAKCSMQLTKDCAASKSKGVSECFQCLREHLTDLRTAGCTAESERLYCDPREE